MNTNCQNSGPDCPAVQIVQTTAKTFFALLFYAMTGEPFDLTGVTEIVALFPGVGGTPIKKTFSNSGGVTVVGSNGAGKIQIALSTTDTAGMQPNPQIAQNLQIIATIAGVAQIDTLSFGSPPVSGTTYLVTLNGVPFAYTSMIGDTAQVVFEALLLLINAAGLPLSSAVSGSNNSAQLNITSSIAGLGFTDVVSSGITLAAATPNGGVRSVFLLQQVLNIQPQDYSGS